MPEILISIIYILLIILIIVAIAIGTKLIVTLSKVNTLLDDVTQKVKTLDKLFELVDTVNDKVALVGDTVVGFVSGGLRRLFKENKKSRRSKKDLIESEDDEDE